MPGSQCLPPPGSPAAIDVAALTEEEIVQNVPASTVNVENEQVLAAQQATADPLHVTDGNWQGAAAESEDELDTTPN